MSDLNASETAESAPTTRVPRPEALMILPRTVARRVVGMLSARGEMELYRRSIGLLGLQLEDVVLEVGCGAGVGIQQAAEIAALGKVCGIEPSEELLAAARARNAEAIDGGYVELQQGLASRLPWPDATFNKALAVNSPRDWPQPVVNLSEIRRTMRPGGKLSVVVQPPWRTARDGVRDMAELWAHRLDEAGFHEVRFGIISAGRGSAAAITGSS